MTKFRTMVLATFGAIMLLSLCLVSANAQVQFMKEPGRTKYTNNPCSSPEISFVLWDESSQERRPTGGVDCNSANYGTWSSVTELKAKLKAYRDSLSRQGVTIGALTVGSDRHTYQPVLLNGTEALRVDYGVIAQGGGNVIAQGGGNFIGHDTGNGSAVIAQGGGNFYGLKAAGDTVVQFPGRWVKVSHPQQQPPRPSTPATPAGSSGSGDAQTRVNLCINSSSGALRQIRGKDGGANNVTFQLGNNQMAVFQGNVLTASYKDQLVSAAKSCGATSVNTNSLRIGK